MPLRNPRRGRIPDPENILRLRYQLGLTQEDLAMKAGYTTRTIQRVEQGQPASIQTLACIAEVLGTDIDQIISDSGEGPKDTTTVEIRISLDSGDTDAFIEKFMKAFLDLDIDATVLRVRSG